MHLAGIDTNLLTTLDALLSEQSVSLAARRIGLSPSATSHALSRLRSVLDDPLLVRAGRSMVLTPRAEQLAPRVRRVVHEMATIFAPEPELEPSTLEREFHFAVAPDYMPLVEQRIGQRLAGVAPGVRLRGRGLPADPAAGLRSGVLDMAIGALESLPDDIEMERLFVDRPACIVRRGHPWEGSPPDTEAFVAATHVVVEPRPEVDRVVDRALAELNLRRRALRTVGDRFAVPFAVAGSDAVAVVSHRFAEAFGGPAGLVEVRMPIDVPGRRIHLAWHRRNHADPAHAWFRDRARRLLVLESPRPAATAA